MKDKLKDRRRYILSLEDEAYQRTRFSFRFRPAFVCLAVALAAVGLLGLAMLMLVVTPLNRLLPDYLTDSQRLASQQAIMRVDSLNQVLAQNRAWLQNFQKLTDINRMPADSTLYARDPDEYNPDSIPDASPLERRFVTALEERERFNISVLAPLDADGMIFVPVASQVYFDAKARQSQTPTVLLPMDTPVQAIADGTVLAVFYNASGHNVMVQHARGFVSGYSHLGIPMVVAGDDVSAGQPLASAPAPDRHAARWIQLRIWHNGSSLIPYNVIGRQ